MNQVLICRSLTLLLGGVCLFLCGCDLPERPRLRSAPADLAGPGSDVQQQAAETALIVEGPSTPDEAEWDTWDAYFVNGQQVGYSHIRSEKTGLDSTSDLRYELETRLYVNQGAARFLQSVSLISTESSQGELLSFDSVVRVGPVPTRHSGSVSEGELRVETLRGDARQTRRIAWESTYRGVVAMEQSLHQRPILHKGETRNLKMLLPARYELATVRMRCDGKAAVPLLDGQLHELLEINCELQPESGAPTYSTIWTNEQGEILRTHSPDLQLIAYRTDKETATQLPVSSHDVASVAVEGAIRNPSDALRVAYKIQRTKAATKANEAPEIPPMPGQYVRQLESGEIQVLVSRRDETVGKGFVAADLEPTEQDLAPSFYVDTEHQQVRKFVSLIIRNREWAEREAAVELNHAVFQNVSARPLVHGFAKASSVGTSWIGDPTERAIFLIALLRHQKIPARLVVGMKYVPGDPDRLVYHAWTIAFVDGDWLHLDPSEGRLAAADRLAFMTTSLSVEDGDNEVDVILPMLNAMRSIQVEVVGQN